MAKPGKEAHDRRTGEDRRTDDRRTGGDASHIPPEGDRRKADRRHGDRRD